MLGCGVGALVGFEFKRDSRGRWQPNRKREIIIKG
jgi:hypothetical protein